MERLWQITDIASFLLLLGSIEDEAEARVELRLNLLPVSQILFRVVSKDLSLLFII